MSGSSELDANAATVERLINDPALRLREASLWYYHFGSTDTAEASDEDLNPHDQALLEFELFRSQVLEGRFSEGFFDETCLWAVDAIEDSESHEPLKRLVEEIGDPRVSTGMVPSLIQRAVATCLSETLFLIAKSLGPDITRKAANRARESEFAEEMDAAVAALVLATVASEVESAMLERGPEIRALIERMEDDASNDRELIRQTDALIALASPWDALVDVYDDDLDSGDEGRVLDGVANLVRSAGVALANHSDDYDQARRLLTWAEEIAQSPSLKSKMAEEFQLLRFMAAHARFVNSLKQNAYDDAVAAFPELQQAAITVEQRAEVAQAANIVANIRSRRVAAQASGSGCGSIIGGLLAMLTIGGIIAAIVRSGGDEPSSGASSNSNISVAGANSNPYRAATPAVDSGREIERLAIEAERSRLDTVKSDQTQRLAEIDSLEASMSVTEALYPNGAPGYVVDEYERQRQRHNTLVAIYNELLAGYQRDLDAFNRRVDAYNAR